MQGQFQVLEHGELLEHGGFLKLATNAQLCNLGLAVAQQINGAAKEHRPTVRSRLARDDVHHRRLAGSVGSNDAAQLSRRDVQRQTIDGLEAVKADMHILQIQDSAMRDVDFAVFHHAPDAGIASTGLGLPGPGSQRCVVGFDAFGALFQQVRRHLELPLSFLTSPTTPSGKYSVTPMNSAPKKYSQNSG